MSDIPPVKALCPVPLWYLPLSRSRAELNARTLNLTNKHPFYSWFTCHNWVQSIISLLSDRWSQLTTRQTPALAARRWEGDSMGRCLNGIGRAPLAWQLSTPTPTVCRPFLSFFLAWLSAFDRVRHRKTPFYLLTKGPAAFQGIDRKDSEGLSEMIAQSEGGEGRGGTERRRRQVGSKRKRSQVTVVTLSSCCPLRLNTTRARQW